MNTETKISTMYSHRYALSVILLLIVIMNYFGEYCAMCDGYGWDGCSYYRGIVENGWSEYLSGCISDYHTHRMLPFLVTHGIMRLLSLSFTPGNVMLVSSLQNAVMLFASVGLFFGVARRLRLKPAVETMAFAFAFFNFHVLKFMGYCPVMTDMPTFFLCWLSAYSFVAGKRWLLLVAGLTSMTVFPLLSLIDAILAFARGTVAEWQEGNKDCKKDYNTNRLINMVVRTVYSLWLPVAFGLYIVFRLIVRHASCFHDVFIVRAPINVPLAVAAIAAYMIFYWRASGYLQIDWANTIRQSVSKRSLTRGLVVAMAFVALYKLPTVCGFAGPFNLPNELAQICQFPATDILIFIETHFLYLGLGFALMIVCWKDICRVAKSWGLGYCLTAMMSLFFMSDIETRKVVCFYIFLLLPLMLVLNRRAVSMRSAVVVATVQALMSFFWLKINVSGITAAFATHSVDVYMQWPSQRYYMFQGPWQSHEVYAVVLCVEIVVLAFMFRRVRRAHR